MLTELSYLVVRFCERMVILNRLDVQFIALVCALVVGPAVLSEVWWLLNLKGHYPFEDYANPLNLVCFTLSLFLMCVGSIYFPPTTKPPLQSEYAMLIVTSAQYRAMLVWLFAAVGGYRELSTMCFGSVVWAIWSLGEQVRRLRRVLNDGQETRLLLDWAQPMLVAQNLLVYWYTLAPNPMMLIFLAYPLLYIQTYGARLLYESMAEVPPQVTTPWERCKHVFRQAVRGYEEDHGVA